tara:strand:+ start:109 stop:558 length:450 start_codon:yes stop_codon:yes gene_type:complete
MNNLRIVIAQTQKVVTTKKELTTDKVTSENKVNLKTWNFDTESKFNQKKSLLAIVNGTYAIIEREKQRKKEGLRPFNPIQISKPLEIVLTWNNSRKIILAIEESGTVKAYNYKQGSKQDLNKAKGRFFHEIKDILNGYNVKDIFEDFTV